MKLPWLICTITVLWYYVTAVACLKCFQTENAMILPGGGSAVAQQYLMQVAAAYTTNRSAAVGLQLNFQYLVYNSQYGLQLLMGNLSNVGYILYASGESFFANDINIYPQIAMVPIIGSSVAILYNLPEVDAAGLTLNLSMPVLVSIYIGTILYWNDSQIRSLNPGVQLPGVLIQVFARSDSAANTRVLTYAFSQVSDDWKNNYGFFGGPAFVGGLCCNSTKWPRMGVNYFANNTYGMVNMATTIPYMLGYVATGIAVQSGATFANVYNRLGYLTQPTSAAVADSVQYWLNQNPNSTYFHIANAPTTAAYPITSFSYLAIDFDTIINFTCCQIREFMGYLDYLLFYPDNAVRAMSNYFVQVPTSIATNVLTSILNKVKCGDEYMYQAYLDSLASPPTLPAYGIGLIVAGAVVLTVLAGVAAFLWYEKVVSDERNWLINSKSLDLDSLLTGGVSMSSIYSGTSSKTSSGPTSSKSSKLDVTGDFNTQFPQPRTMLDDKPVMLLDMDIKLPKHWKNETRMFVSRCCQRLSNPNVGHLFGVTVVGNRVFAVQEFHSQGTLYHVLRTSRFDFSDSIRVSFASDAAEAIMYLHSKGIIVGLLNSLSCFVSTNWSLKLYRFDKGALKQERTMIQLLYLEPEAAKTSKFTVLSDVFSFGVLLAEIINRNTPYSLEVSQNKLTYYQLLKNKFELQLVPVPQLSTTHASRLVDLCTACIKQQHTTFGAVATELRTEQYHGGVTDILMETMEAIIGDLEKKSEELKRISAKTRQLLHQVLPPSVAEKLSNHQTVDPEYFQSVSVFYSDVVGFTKISAASTPLQVMTFLNDLWTVFDSVIEKIDCYKVDTIGDAYLVCSGLPNRNGTTHVKNIADLALAIRQASRSFVIRHMPDEALKIRIGLNTGPVTAGVVGTRMPQYCVFGETVNTATKMEQTSVAGKIHTSNSTAQMLVTHYPQYHLEPRGSIDIKGKDTINTYWLEDTSDFHESPMSEVNNNDPDAMQQWSLSSNADFVQPNVPV